MSETYPFLDPDFEAVPQGTDTLVRCKHCGAVMDVIKSEEHRRTCQAKR